MEKVEEKFDKSLQRLNKFEGRLKGTLSQLSLKSCYGHWVALSFDSIRKLKRLNLDINRSSCGYRSHWLMKIEKTTRHRLWRSCFGSWWLKNMGIYFREVRLINDCQSILTTWFGFFSQGQANNMNYKKDSPLLQTRSRRPCPTRIHSR